MLNLTCMKKVSKETLIIATRKLMMEMSDEEYDKLTSDFETITMQMDLIKDIEGVDDVEPITFPFEVTVATAVLWLTYLAVVEIPSFLSSRIACPTPTVNS